MLLDVNNKSLEFVLGAAHTTNQLTFIVVSNDLTSSTFTPAENDGVSNDTTAVTMVAAPDPNHQKQIKHVAIFNTDTVPATVTVSLNNNTVLRTLIKVTLSAGDCLFYDEGAGWRVVDSNGIIRTGGIAVLTPIFGVNASKDLANITAVTAPVSGTCHVLYLGQAPKVTNSINLLVNVTTQVQTITWAEVAIYIGTPRLGALTLDLTRLGWTDVSGTYNSTGIKNTNISLTRNLAIGEHLYAILGCNATTPFVLRGGLADNLQTGQFQTLAARLSTTAGPTAGTLAANNLVPPWLAYFFN
jgi:hypothetical protein